MLFAAVAERLCACATNANPPAARAAIEECVRDLDMLRAELDAGDSRLQRIELQLRQARADLDALTTHARGGQIPLREDGTASAA